MDGPLLPVPGQKDGGLLAGEGQTPSSSFRPDAARSD